MGRSGDAFHSPDMQIEAMRRSIGLAGLREVAVVEDIDASGQTFSREGIDKIRAMVEAKPKQVDVIALYDLSRLGRNLAESLTFVRWLRERGVTVMSTQERIDDSPEGQYMLGQFLGLAELYGNQVGRRWAQIISRRAARGQHHGRPPTGYVKDEAGRLVPDLVLGPAMTAVFADYATGEFVGQLRRRLGQVLAKPPTVKALKGMLRNPVYLGRVHVSGARTGDVEASDEHTHEPLTDPETYTKVQQRLARDARTPAHLLAPRYSITGLCRCAVCEQSAQARPRTGRKPGERVVRWTCYGSWTLPRKCGGCGHMTLSQIEAEVLAQVAQYIAELRGNVAAVANRRTRAAQAGIDRAAVEQELAKVRKAMVRLAASWALGDVPDAVYQESMDGFRADETRLSQALAAHTGVERPLLPEEIVPLADELLRLWPRMDGQQRNRALRTIVDRVVLSPASFYREPAKTRVKVHFR